MTPPRAHGIAAVLLALAALAGCGGGSGQALKQRASSSAREQTSGPAPTIAGAVPPQLDPLNVYAAAGAGALSPVVRTRESTAVRSALAANVTADAAVDADPAGWCAACAEGRNINAATGTAATAASTPRRRGTNR